MDADMRVGIKLWIEAEDGLLLGKGRVRLLKAIDRFGSIHRASKELGISYKKAWHQIEDLNRHAPKPVVERKTGGKNGGGTRLTPYGRAVIRWYEQLEGACRHFAQQKWDAYVGEEH